MNRTPRTRDEMARLLAESLQAHPLPGEPINDEHLILLASGCGDRIPEPARERLLRQIAGNTEAAELLRDLHQFSLQEATAKKSGPRMHLVMFTRMAWAVAACVAVGLGTWRLVDPPRLLQTQAGDIRPLHHNGSAQNDYWDQLDRQQVHDRWERERLREFALVAACGTCLLLSFIVVWQGRRSIRD